MSFYSVLTPYSSLEPPDLFGASVVSLFIAESTGNKVMTGAIPSTPAPNDGMKRTSGAIANALDGDWTFECFISCGNGGVSRLFAYGGNSFLTLTGTLNAMTMTWYDYSNGSTPTSSVDMTLMATKMCHLAISVSGTTFRAFFEGKKFFETTSFIAPPSQTSLGLNTDPTGTSGMEAFYAPWGAIGVTKVCKYTADFTPPENHADIFDDGYQAQRLFSFDWLSGSTTVDREGHTWTNGTPLVIHDLLKDTDYAGMDYRRDAGIPMVGNAVSGNMALLKKDGSYLAGTWTTGKIKPKAGRVITIEQKIIYTNTVSDGQYLLAGRENGQPVLYFRLSSAGIVETTVNSPDTPYSQFIAPNVVHDLAIVQDTDADTIKYFINGTLVRTGVASTTGNAFAGADGVLKLVADVDNNIGTESGGVRIVASRVTYAERYTASYTPAPFPKRAVSGSMDKRFSGPTHLLKFNGANNGTVFTDNVTTQEPWTRQTNTFVTSTTHNKFPTASGRFGASSDSLQCNGGVNNYLGKMDFCFEGWVRLLNTSGDKPIFVIGTRQNNGDINALLLQASGSSLNVRRSDFTGYSFESMGSSAGLTTSTYRHIAITRQAGVVRAFHEGVKFAEFNHNVAIYSDSILIGDNTTNIHIDEFRMTRGSAVYTANFSPPTAEF